MCYTHCLDLLTQTAGGTFLEKRRVRGLDSLSQADPRPPTKGAQFRYIHELPWSAVGFAGIPVDASLESHRIFDRFRKLADRYVGAGAHVDPVGRIVHAQKKCAGIRQIVDMEKLAAWRACAPGFHRREASGFRLVEFSDERG